MLRNEKERESLYAELFDKYGIKLQEDMLVEEVGELLASLNQFRRGKATKEDVVSEIADVLNCIEQMRYIFGKDAVDSQRELKLKRTELKLFGDN